MRPLISAAGVAAAIALSANGVAVAADEEAGVSLAPSEAAGAWTLESQGRSICVLKLGAEKTGAGAYKLAAPANCGDALPAGVAGWSPSPDGMNLVDADGRTLIRLRPVETTTCLSPHQTSGVDVQLRRGQPNNPHPVQSERRLSRRRRSTVTFWHRLSTSMPSNRAG